MGFLYSQFFVTPPYPTLPFNDQTVIVTGSNVGLGLEASRHIVRLNAAKVILAVRNLTAGEEAKQSIEQSTGRPGTCEVWHLDLSSYDSVIAFVKRAEKLPRLDAIIANAAIATGEFKMVQGHESTITVNVLSTMLLGLLILPKLRETGKKFPSSQPHLTFVVSEVHAWSKFAEIKSDNTLAALDDQANTKFSERYPTSKLLEVLLIRELVDKLSDDEVVINMLNPGLCHSQLNRDSSIALELMKMVMARTTEVGSRTLVVAANAGKDSHGKYMTDGHVADDALSSFVRSEDGKKAQQKMWNEVMGVLEGVSPGVTQIVY